MVNSAVALFLSKGDSMGNIRRFFLVGIIAVCFFSAVGFCADQPFGYFLNDFNIIGLKDYDRGTRITPYKRLVLAGDSRNTEHEPDATVQIRFGRDLRIVGLEPVSTLLDGWIPVVLFTARDGGVRYDFKIWASPLPSVSDWKGAYDGPVEGENYLTWVWVKVTNEGSESSVGKLRFEQCGNSVKGEHPVPMLDEPMDFSWGELGSSQSVEAVVRLPWYPLSDKGAFDNEKPGVWLGRTVGYWREKIGSGALFEVPCKKTVDTYKTALAYQMIVLDGGQVKGGESVYDGFWMRDGAYQIMQFEEAGFFDEARKALASYFPYQRPTGIFQSQAGQLDSNGQTAWAFWQYYKITGDRKWLEQVYPLMYKAANWTMKARREAGIDLPFAGLMPVAKGEGENMNIGNEHHIVGADLWNLRGLLITADAAKVLGKRKDAEELVAEAGDYRKSIDAAFKHSGEAHFPPAWDDVGDKVGVCYSHWGNMETLWPTELFEVDDVRVESTISELRDRHGGGYVEGLSRFTIGIVENMVPSTEDPLIVSYLTTYVTLAEMISGNDERVAEAFYWFLLHTTSSNMFGEVINYRQRYGFCDTLPHVTGAAMFCNMFRHMLIHERGDVLELLWGVPDWWIGEGQEIRIERAPTHFGFMNLRVRGKADGVEVDFDAPDRSPAEKIVLHLPQSRKLLKPVEGVEVVYRSVQKRRWDFPGVVKIYEADARSVSDIVNDKFSKADIEGAIAFLDAVEDNSKYYFDQQYWDRQSKLWKLSDKLRQFTESGEAKEEGVEQKIAVLQERIENCLELVGKGDYHKHQRVD